MFKSIVLCVVLACIALAAAMPIRTSKDIFYVSDDYPDGAPAVSEGPGTPTPSWPNSLNLLVSPDGEDSFEAKDVRWYEDTDPEPANLLPYYEYR